MIAAHLDRQHRPGGSVLMDSFVGWAVWLASDDTKQFVITSDYDFVAVLNRPWDFGITYIVMRNPDGSDAPRCDHEALPHAVGRRRGLSGDWRSPPPAPSERSGGASIASTARRGR